MILKKKQKTIFISHFSRCKWKWKWNEWKFAQSFFSFSFVLFNGFLDRFFLLLLLDRLSITKKQKKFFSYENILCVFVCEYIYIVEIKKKVFFFIVEYFQFLKLRKRKFFSIKFNLKISFFSFHFIYEKRRKKLNKVK